MTADRSQGVILWSEDTDNLNQDSVWRLDFTVDDSVNPDGELVLGTPVQILPLVGEEAAPGDYLFSMSPDIWGDATHDSLILAIGRGRAINSGPDTGASTDEMVIYDLDDLTGDLLASPDVRVLFSRQKGAGGGVLEFGTWLDAGDPADLPDCFSVPYPQFVPTCYRAASFGFNPSGTRLYFERRLSTDFTGGVISQWYGVQRIHIDKTAGPDLADWMLTGPELVYTAGPTSVRPRPDNDALVLPSPEYIAVVVSEGTGRLFDFTSIMDADQCTLDFAPYAGGNLEGPTDLSLACVDSSTFFAGNENGSGDSWQSPDALLKSSFQDPEFNINRVYVSGGLAGTEELMIETARFGDAGN